MDGPNLGNLVGRLDRRVTSPASPDETTPTESPEPRLMRRGNRSLTGPTAVSRSGLWLILGTLIFAAGVLAWAFGDELRGVTIGQTLSRPDSLAVSGGRRATPVNPAAVPEAGTARPEPPTISEYAPLLGRNVFQPRGIPSPEVRAPSSQNRPESNERREERGDGIQTEDEWRDWEFTGLAQLDGATYALIEQPDRKRSFFLREGDRLEDATLTRIDEDAVMIRDEDGEVTRLLRVDAMEELLRSSDRRGRRR